MLVSRIEYEFKLIRTELEAVYRRLDKIEKGKTRISDSIEVDGDFLGSVNDVGGLVDMLSEVDANCPVRFSSKAPVEVWYKYKVGGDVVVLR